MSPLQASKQHRKPWSRAEERALVQFVCIHQDRKSPSSTAVWPSMSPSYPYWNEAAHYIKTTTGQSHLRTGNFLPSYLEFVLIVCFSLLLMIIVVCLLCAYKYYCVKLFVLSSLNNL